MTQGKDPGVYKIINAKGGTALDLSGGDNYSIIGYPYNGGGNQKWIISDPDDNDNQTIQNEGSGLFLAIEGDPGDDQKVIARDEPFAWAIRRDWSNPDNWRVYIPETPFNVDLTNYGSDEPGTTVAVWGAWEASNQTWHFDSPDEPAGDEHGEDHGGAEPEE